MAGSYHAQETSIRSGEYLKCGVRVRRHFNMLLCLSDIFHLYMYIFMNYVVGLEKIGTSYVCTL